MVDDTMELVRGSGNVCRDFGYPDAEVRQAKALLGVPIIRILDVEGLSTREAKARTGVRHAELALVRNAKFGRFTIDRLVGILEKLGFQGINLLATDDRV